MLLKDSTGRNNAAIATEHLPKLGECGNCGDKALHPLDTICKTCAKDLGLAYDTFPNYYYPSELLFNSAQATYARIHFIFY